jgi:hypothetical protein
VLFKKKEGGEGIIWNIKKIVVQLVEIFGTWWERGVFFRLLSWLFSFVTILGCHLDGNTSTFLTLVVKIMDVHIIVLPRVSSNLWPTLVLTVYCYH